MKKLLLLALFALPFVAHSKSKLNAEAYVVVVSPKMRFEVVDVDKTSSAEVGKLKHGDDKVDDIVRFKHRNQTEAWENVSFKVKALDSGEVSFTLSGVHKFKDGVRQCYALAYDDFKLNGKPFENGSFDDGLKKWTASTNYPTKVMTETLPNGKINNYLRAWSLTYATQKFYFEAGKTYEFTFKIRPIGKMNIKTGEVPLDISKYANIDLSKFGVFKSKLNLANLDYSRKNFGGVNFNLIQPSQNNGNGGIVFASKGRRKNIEKIEISPKEVIVGRYLYLLHTSFYAYTPDIDVAKLKLTSADGITKEYKIQRRRDSWLFTDERNYHANILPVYYADPAKRTGKLYLSRFDIPDGSLSKVEIESCFGDAFILLGATTSPKGVPTVEIVPFDNSKWVKADIPMDMEVKKGSPLDQSVFFDDKPAGTYGRVILSERGTLAFEKTPHKDARFKGFSEYSVGYFAKRPMPDRIEAIKRYAQSFKKTGYNSARISFEVLKDDMSDYDREVLYDTADRLIAELKKNGVYVHLTLVWYRLGLKDYQFYIRDDVKLRAVFGDPHVRSLWKKTAEFVLNHYNPYTGMRWKDDPVFICAEYYNELAICFSRMDETSKFHPKDTILPETKKLVMSKWHKWLKNRYGGSISKLNSAWEKNLKKKFNFKRFNEVPCIVKGNDDWTRCCWDHLEDFVCFAEKVVEDAGYKGLKVQNNLGPISYGVAVRSRTTDYVIANTYNSHPTSFNYNDAMCSQGDCISGMAGYWRGIASMKINNRPFFVTEYNHCFWNMSRYQFPTIFAPLSAYQNFAGLTIHSDAVPSQKLQNPPRLGAFAVAYSPVARASELVSSSTFIRGDVKPAKHRVDIKFTEDFMKNNDNATKAVSTFQSRIMLMTGYATAFDGRQPKAVQNVKVKPADFTISPVGSSEVLSEAWFHSVIDNKDSKFDLKTFVENMRQKGVLSPDNKTDISNGIFHTDTEEIYMDTKKIIMKVVTDCTELVSMKNPKVMRLKSLKVVSCDTPSTIGAVSLDGKPISSSDRLMLLFVTRESNSDMKLTEDGVISKGAGKAPILLLKSKMRAELRLDPNAKYEVYPIALNGERRAKLPFVFEDGVMKIEIDNSKLPNGATPFFEIAKVK